MKTIRLSLFACVALFALASVAQAAAAAASVRALLITASNQKGAADPKLKDYEAELQRNLPESSFRLVGQGTANLAEGAHATITLSGGHSIVVDREKGSGPGIRLKVQWLQAGKEVNGGTFTREPGAPVVLVTRPSGDGEVPIILLIAK